MRKLYYDIGYINRYVSLRFTVTTRTSKGVFCLESIMNGDGFEVKNLYPTITVVTTDEVRDDARKWKPERNFSLSRFTSIPFIKKAKRFLQRYVDEKQLFRYVDGVLTVDKDIARRIAFKADTEYNVRILVLPVVTKDPEMGQLYEGVAICIRDMSNHTVMTYDEFSTFVEYLSKFHFDLMALKLLTVAIISNGIQRVATGQNLVTRPEEKPAPPVVVKDVPVIPKLE